MRTDDVLALLRKRMGKRTAKDVAQEWDISGAYLSDVLAGRKAPGESILCRLGLERETIYRKKTA